MPIDIQRFKEAQVPVKERVFGLLRRKTNQALSLMEIISECEGYPPNSSAALLIALEKIAGAGGSSETWAMYEKAVSDLVGEGKIAEAEVQGTTYYAVLDGE